MTKFKYKLLRLIDICGLAFLDPVVRLCYGEEPQKQVREIGKIIVVPAIAFTAFIIAWSWSAPRHTTKSGEVPTPGVVWEAAQGIWTFHKREGAKKEAFVSSRSEAEHLLGQAEARMASLIEREIPALDGQISSLKDAEDAWLLKNVVPHQLKVEKRESDIKQAQKDQVAKIKASSLALSSGNSENKDALLADLRSLEDQNAVYKQELSAIKAELTLIERKQFPATREARKNKDRLEEEKQFLSVLTSILKENRSAKVDALNGKIATMLDKYTAMDGAKAYSAARVIIKNESRLATTEASSYSAAKTLPYQTKRSLLCVFAGFVLASVIAIPIGILCGLSRVFMAAVTPFIALFKPVSPIVWLPIALIVVGGFIPDPSNNGFLSFINSLPFINNYEINPAFLASAITVALCSLWPTLVNTALGVASIEKDHVNVARVLKLGFWSRLTTIVIPSALPLIFAGLRISLGVGWMVLIAAELLSSSEGIGKFVWDMFNNGSSDSFAQMFVVVFLVGFIGLALDRIMIVFQRLVSFDGSPTAL
jgi:nitrate/nitrite transport system permease protein